MKKTELIKKIRRACKEAGISWEKASRAGAEHDIYAAGKTDVAIPRHREIKQFTAEAIFKELEVELGENWWR